MREAIRANVNDQAPLRRPPARQGVSMSRISMDRRRFGTGLAAAAAALPLASSLIPRALAGAAEGDAAAGSTDVWLELDDLTGAATRLGLSPPRMSLGPATQSDDITDVAPAILDFMKQVEASGAETPSVSPAEVEVLLDRASNLLVEVTQKERSPREMEEGDEGFVPDAAQHAGAYPTMPPLKEIEADYRNLFATCQVRDQYKAAVDDYVSRMLDNRERYMKIYDSICVPWFFVGGIHALEASFNFRTHLHNGDSLSSRTTHVPSGQPRTWNPPSDWESSAVDALKAKKYDQETSWTLPEILYRWEKYNGVRSRVEHGINTPYLWSFSQHYTKGKFVADNVWDTNAVSKQVGAAVILRRLVDLGKVRPLGV
jgi:lysozyme family protein